jgi:hypothetical protein
LCFDIAISPAIGLEEFSKGGGCFTTFERIMSDKSAQVQDRHSGFQCPLRHPCFWFALSIASPVPVSKDKRIHYRESLDGSEERGELEV